MAAIHADRVSIPAQAFLQILLQVQPADPQVAAARELLLAWDGNMDRTSAAATLYGTAKTYWLADVLQHALGRFATDALSSGIGRGASTHAVQIYARAVTAMVRAILPCCPGVGPGLSSQPWVGRWLNSGSAWVMICIRGPGTRCIIRGHVIPCRVSSRNWHLFSIHRRWQPVAMVIHHSRVDLGA